MDRVGSFREFLPTQRANYAYLEGGRIIMKDMFIWMNGGNDIPNVESFLLNDKKWDEEKYKKSFYEDTRDGFKHKGIGKIDITALWRMFHLVRGFFTKKAQDWTDVETFLTTIKDKRNDILHNIFLEKRVQSEDELKSFLQEVSKMAENAINVFEKQYVGFITEEQKQKLRDCIKDVIDDANEKLTRINVCPTGTDASVMAYSYQHNSMEYSKMILELSGNSNNLAMDIQGYGGFSVNPMNCNNVSVKTMINDFRGATINVQPNITSSIATQTSLMDIDNSETGFPAIEEHK